MAKYKVLSTKKLEPSLVEQADKEGIEIIEQETIRVNPILSKGKWEEIFQLVETKKLFAVFTSSNAVEAVRKCLGDYVNPCEVRWKIFSLAGKTREILEVNKNSLGTIVAVAENSKALAGKIVEANVDEVTFFCGNKRRDELPAILKDAGIKVNEVVVYETVETPVIFIEGYDAALFFSPSAVHSFFSVNQLNKDAVCFAIGQTTADSIAAASARKIIVAKTPRQEALLQEVINYFKSMVKQD